MEKNELQQFIYSNIPVVEKNNFTVKEVENLTAKIKGCYLDHTNHRKTVFGGSISTALTLAAWSHLRLMMEESEVSAGTVVGKQSIYFYKPVTSDFYGVAVPTEKEKKLEFFTCFKEKGKAKLTIKAQLLQENDKEVKAVFEGDFYLLSDTQG